MYAYTDDFLNDIHIKLNTGGKRLNYKKNPVEVALSFSRQLFSKTDESKNSTVTPTPVANKKAKSKGGKKDDKKPNKWKGNLKVLSYVLLGLVLIIAFSKAASLTTSPSTTKEFEKHILKNEVKKVNYIESAKTIKYTLKKDAQKAAEKKVKDKGFSKRTQVASGDFTVSVMNEYFTVNKTVYDTMKKNKVDFKVSKPSSVGNTIFRLVYFLFLLAIIFTAVTSIRSFKKGIDLEEADTKGLTFDDVAGLEEVKKEIKRVIHYLKNRDELAEYVDSIPKGILFEGAPGNGKTLLAKVIASEANAPFFYVSASEIEGSFVAEGARKVRNMFKEIRKVIENKGSAILFLDEIDSIGLKRENRSVAETSQTLNQLLTELDGFSESDNLLVIGATNLVANLDSALIRSGRFDRIIKIPNPGEKDRKKILDLYIEKKKDKFDSGVFESDFVEVLSVQTSGMSSSDLSRLVSDALLMALDEETKVTNAHLRNAYLQIVMGLPNSEQPDPVSRKIVAYHEAGHAIVSMLTSDLGYGAVAYGTIRPYGQFGGHISYIQNRSILSRRSEYLNRVKVLLAGRAVENIILSGDYTDGAANDLMQVRSTLNSYVAKLGMSETFINVSTDTKENSELIEAEVNRLVKELTKEVDNLVSSNFSEIESFAAYLLEHQDIEREDIVRLYSEKYPKKEVLFNERTEPTENAISE